MSDKMSIDDAYSIIQRANEIFEAAIKQGNANAPYELQPLTIDLSVAKLETSPLELRFPFKTVYIQDASDSSAYIYLRPNTQDSYQGQLKLQKKDSFKMERPATKSYLWWPAQAGKTMTIVFMVSSNIDTGTKGSEISSSVDGNNINEYAPVTVSTTSANLIDQTIRNVISIQNEGPNDCYIGGSGVSAVAGSERGLLLPAGGERVYKNTAAVYAASVGSSVLRFQTES